MKPFKPVNKYHAKRTRGYASKREAQYADELLLRQRAGEVVDWLEQVRIKLPGGNVYIVDFVVFGVDGATRFVEIKGHQTEQWTIKLRALEAARPWVFERLEVLK